MIRATWSDEIALLLLPTLENTPLSDVQVRIESGQYELWLQGRTVIVLERVNADLRVWAIAGKNLATAAREVIRYAARNEFCTLKFRTTHAGVLRLLWNFNPVLTDAGNCEYTVWLAQSRLQAQSPAPRSIRPPAVSRPTIHAIPART